jgi:sulfate/thiosulfate-binding protein
MKVRAKFAAGLVAAGMLLAAGCGGGSGGSDGGSGKLTLVAYSTPREAYEQLIPAFQKTAAGQGIGFSQSYGASGDQSRAVQNGLAADVVTLALEPDMTKLVDAGLVAEDWNADDHKGMITNSVVVFIVRKGNPKNIRTWDDLIRPGVEVIEPNPFTSGGAKWNIMAAYGAQLRAGRTPEQAADYLLELFRHVPVQDKSAREALQTFIGGKGDVMLAYENEAINAQQKEQPVDYVVPDTTILIENPIAVVAKSRNAEAAKAFVEFLRSEPAQKLYAERGYRPVNEAAAAGAEFPEPPGLFTIKDLGGWADVNKKFFDKEAGIVAEIERTLGVSVGS